MQATYLLLKNLHSPLHTFGSNKALNIFIVSDGFPNLTKCLVGVLKLRCVV